MNDVDSINKYLTGLKLTKAEASGDELRLIFEGDLTLIVTGGYCKEVFAEIKQRVVYYETLR